MRSFALVLILAAGCGSGDVPAPPPREASPLPPPMAAPEGWTIAEGPVEYSSGTLFEYMNGGAERYQAHGFQRLIHLRYQFGDDPLSCVTLDLYDMGSDLGAFGIYSAGRPRDIDERPWGAEGYRVGAIVAAYKRSVYLHGEADDQRPEVVAMLDDLMVESAAAVDGDVSPPVILVMLPTSGRVPYSERFVAADLLGHSFLPGGVFAEYEVDGLSAALFFTDLGSAADARRALDRLSTEFERRAVVIAIQTDAGGGGFEFTEPLLGSGSVIRVGSVLAGVYGRMAAEDRERILGELAAALEGG